MKKIFIPVIAFLGLTSCQDCKDCTLSTNISVLVETFNPDTSSTVSLENQSGVFVLPTTGSELLEDLFIPVGYGEFCGTDLKDVDGQSTTFTESVGDSSTTLYTYTWTETYDCK